MISPHYPSPVQAIGPTFEQASARYSAARAEFLAASEQLRRIMAREAPRAPLLPLQSRYRRSWSEAAAMAAKVRQMHADCPQMTQREIGAVFGIDAALVGHYLSPKCKAALRVPAKEKRPIG